MKTTFGLVSRMRANAMRCCSPGESTLAQSSTSDSRLAQDGSATLFSMAISSSSGISPGSLG